jgi:hypothetical protein
MSSTKKFKKNGHLPSKNPWRPSQKYLRKKCKKSKPGKKERKLKERMKIREKMKEQSKELNSMSTLAVLESNDIILPPLRSISRLSTMSPKPEKFKGANVFNINGSIRFTRSPRFDKV